MPVPNKSSSPPSSFPPPPPPPPPAASPPLALPLPPAGRTGICMTYTKSKWLLLCEDKQRGIWNMKYGFMKNYVGSEKPLPTFFMKMPRAYNCSCILAAFRANGDLHDVALPTSMGSKVVPLHRPPDTRQSVPKRLEWQRSSLLQSCWLCYHYPWSVVRHDSKGSWVVGCLWIGSPWYGIAW